MNAILGYCAAHPWTYPVLLVAVNLVFFYGGRALARHGDIREHPAWSRVLEMAESYAKAGDDEETADAPATVARGSARIERLALPERATAVAPRAAAPIAVAESATLASTREPAPSERTEPLQDPTGHGIPAIAVIASIALTVLRFVSNVRTRDVR